MIPPFLKKIARALAAFVFMNLILHQKAQCDNSNAIIDNYRNYVTIMQEGKVYASPVKSLPMRGRDS
jgi:hypothetical protein